MVSPCMVTIDVGQAYEEAPSEVVEAAVVNVFPLYHNEVSRNKMVTTYRTTKTKMEIGGSISLRLGDRWQFRLPKLQAIAQALFRLRLFMFGDKVARQIEIIPIGDPCSATQLEHVASTLQYIHDRYHWPAMTKRKGVNGFRSSFITTAHVADSTYGDNECICVGCLKDYLISVYVLTRTRLVLIVVT